MQPTIHVVGLAHIPTKEESPMWACAFTQKIVKQCSMFKKLGYRVIFYGVEGSDVECDECVTVLEESKREKVYGDLGAFAFKPFDPNPDDEVYMEFKQNLVVEMKKRINPLDIAMNPMGCYFKEVFRPEKYGGIEICNGTPFMVEGGVGYSGILTGGNYHRVFESNSWRAFVYGKHNIEDIDNYDTVIPNYYDPKRFDHTKSREDYYVQICRRNYRKGIMVSKAFIEAIDGKLILAGQPGDIPESQLKSKNIECLGYVDESEKLDLLAHAKGLLCPTLYNPPFEGVSVEAMLSGCPVIANNFGCFVETIPEGIAGYRCYTLKDWVRADSNIHKIDHNVCRKWAEDNFSMDACGLQYQEYFNRLEDLNEKGWYQL